MTMTFTHPVEDGIDAHIFKNTTGQAFDFAVQFYRENQCWPTFQVIQERLERRPRQARLETSIQYGKDLGIFRMFGQHIMAMVPPHVEIIRHTSATLGIAPAEIIGVNRTMRAVRARRIICKTLLARPTPYNIRMICRAIGKDHGTILDYLYLDRASMRSDRRKIQKLQIAHQPAL